MQALAMADVSGTPSPLPGGGVRDYAHAHPIRTGRDRRRRITSCDAVRKGVFGEGAEKAVLPIDIENCSHIW